MKLNSDKDFIFHSTLTTSKGNQLKCLVNNRWYKADYLGYEGAAEYISSKILACSNIKHYVSYSISDMVLPKYSQNFKGCSSKNFLKPNEILITADKLFKQNFGPNYLLNYQKMSLKDSIVDFVTKVEELTKIPDFGKKLTALLEFDAFILNDDRHFNNIAFIIKEDNTYEFAPIFDNGGAFLSDIKYDYPLSQNFHGLIPNVKAKPFHENFDKQIETCQSLFGSQLQISNTLNLDAALEKVQTLYGDDITKRISDVFHYSKYMYPEFIVNKTFEHDLDSIDYSIENISFE